MVLQSATKNPRDFYYSTVFRNLNYVFLANSSDKTFIRHLSSKFIGKRNYLENCFRKLEKLKNPQSFLAINLDHNNQLATRYPVIINMFSKYPMLVKQDIE